MWDLKEPRNVTELQSILCQCNAYRRFIPSFTRLADPFNKKLRNIQTQTVHDLTKGERTATSTVQERVVSSFFLLIPRSRGRYNVSTDSADKHFGAVLLQEKLDEPPKRIEYWSRDLQQFKH